MRHLFGPENPILINSVENYRRLLTTGWLPKAGPQDDMTKAPQLLGAPLTDNPTAHTRFEDALSLRATMADAVMGA